MEFNGIKARWWRRIGAAGCAALVTLLAGCGGGDPIERFRPTRIVSFGDEASMIVAPAGTTDTKGKKYTVNAVDTSASAPANTYVCTSNPVWIQSVASAFGLSFKACPPSATSSPTGLIYATPKAKVADVRTQIDNFLATEGTPLSHADVVTVMAGLYDVLEQYSLYPATPEATLKANIEQRGKDLATQINRIALTGAPVIVLRLPGVGYTPFGVQQQAEGQALLNRLTTDFNNALQLNLINDGHLIGLVYADADVQTVVNNASAFGMLSVTEPACQQAANATNKQDDSVLLDCTTSTLVTRQDSATVTSTNYLWAGNLQLSPYGHSRLGSLAASRAINNPF
jgi:hypothetical protein